MRGATLMVLALAGCNQAFSLQETILVDADLRPDLDHDMIADVEDPCIAPASDGDADFDADGIPNGIDKCPFWKDAADPDEDGDGVGDACDSFPGNPGDHRQCMMAFTSRELSAVLWAPRPGEGEFAVATGLMLALNEGSAIEQERVMPRAPTITIDAVFTTGFMDLPINLGVWLSAGPTRSDQDVACGIVGAPNGALVAVTGPAQAVSAVGGGVTANVFIVRAVLEPDRSGTNLLCAVGYSGGVLTARTHIDAPLGSFGFVSNTGANAIDMVMINTRDDMPAIPGT